jgi:Integrase core domain
VRTSRIPCSRSRKLSRLEPVEPRYRYEKRRAGELLRIDVKRLGRVVVPGHRVTGNRRQRAGARRIGGGRRVGNAGWEFVHVCVDDATRLAFAEVLPTERATTAVGFLRRCLAFYRAHGISVERVLTDNGSAYISAVFAIACRRPMARPSASSGRCFASGPTQRFTAPPSSERRRYQAGWSATTRAEDTAPSVTGRRSRGYGSSKGITWLAATASAPPSKGVCVLRPTMSHNSRDPLGWPGSQP